MSSVSKGQISVEYMILVGFITFTVISIVSVATIYISQIQDTLKFHQLDRLSDKIISSAQAVYYAGEPSKISVTVYMPKGVDDVQVLSNELVFTIQTSTGISMISYASDVPLQGSIPSTEGVRHVDITAQSDFVVVNGA